MKEKKGTGAREFAEEASGWASEQRCKEIFSQWLDIL
jgi:hypothetical protein